MKFTSLNLRYRRIYAEDRDLLSGSIHEDQIYSHRLITAY